MNKNIKKVLKDANKKTVTVYFVLRFLVIVSLIAQIFHKNWHNVFLCILTLVLFTIPFIVDKKFKINLPTMLEIIILLFIFSAEILGEIQNFYGIFKHWDTVLHTLNGFLSAAIGFSMIDILNRTERFHIKLTPIFVSLVAFCFSMTIGVLWEFFEFSGDQLFNMDMQKDRVVETISTVELNPEEANVPIIIDNIKKTTISYIDESGKLQDVVIKNGYLDLGVIDTMKDLIVNFVGAIVFSVIGYLYIENRDKFKIAENFIPVVRE